MNVKMNRFKLLERTNKQKAMDYYKNVMTFEERVYMAIKRSGQEYGK